MKGYDALAFGYDALKWVVFGSAPLQAECHFLDQIPIGASILIVGGGTGALLEAIAAIHPRGLRIVYVDASPKMVARAQKRNVGDNHVTFIVAAFETVQFHSTFDVVITSFLLDNFEGAALQRLLHGLRKAMAPGGRWLDTDFCEPKTLSQKLLMKTMYVFFGTFCGVAATKLENVDNFFENQCFKYVDSAFYGNEFIKTRMYVDK
jgi:ubiquinone/menaquinone biosynthesis C-methylase UbiE